MIVLIVLVVLVVQSLRGLKVGRFLIATELLGSAHSLRSYVAVRVFLCVGVCINCRRYSGEGNRSGVSGI